MTYSPIGASRQRTGLQGRDDAGAHERRLARTRGAYDRQQRVRSKSTDEASDHHVSPEEQRRIFSGECSEARVGALRARRAFDHVEVRRVPPGVVRRSPHDRRRLRAIRAAKLPEDVVHVAVCGRHADDERLRDLPVRPADRYEPEDLALPLCQLRQWVELVLDNGDPGAGGGGFCAAHRRCAAF